MRHNDNHKAMKAGECATCREEENYDKAKKFEKKIMKK